MATYHPPASFEDLVRDYDHFIEVSISRISCGRVRQDDVEDLKQAVYTRMWETGYLGRYDGRKGSVSNYLYVLIRSVMSNVFDKNTRNPLNMAFGVMERPDVDVRNRPTDRKRLVLDAHPAGQDRLQEERLQLKDVVNRLREYAAAQSNGARLCQVLEMLYQGHQIKDIAAAVGKSGTTVMFDRKRLAALLAQAS